MLAVVADLPAAEPAPAAVIAAGLALLILGLALRATSRLARRARPVPRGVPPPAAPTPPITPAARSRERPAMTALEPSEPSRARLPAESVAPLGRCLEASRRLRAAEDGTAAALAFLPPASWLTQRDVAVGARRVPLLLAGATGVFALWPSDGAWTMRDIGVLDIMRTEVARLLPGYDGPVHAAIVLAGDDAPPRIWHRGEDAASAWVLGTNWLPAWILGFDPRHGLRPGDVARLERQAAPTCERPPLVRLPATPPTG